MSTSPPAASTERAAPAPRVRRSNATLGAFLVGLPLAAAILGLVHWPHGPLSETPLPRFLKHEVEWVEVILFSCAIGALGSKLWFWRKERAACSWEGLPAWDGRAVPSSQATALLARLNQVPRQFQNTYLVNRVAAILDFLCRRGSANELDDHLRDLADNDSLILENSYALVRFITWAIPILGFLGTVLGITGAIANVTPEQLEKDVGQVTTGLSLAFDATAVALALTMVTMFVTFLVDRVEQNVLEAVNRYVDRHLAHRFERAGSGAAGQVLEMVRQQTQILVQSSEELVRRQAEVWAQTLTQVNHHRHEVEAALQERATAALETALERTLDTHSRRLAALEKQTAHQNSGLLEQMAVLANAFGQQQAVYGQIAESLGSQTSALARLHEGERHLVQAQELLNQNLAALASASTVEQVLHSLTAAVHLLSARSSGTMSGAGPSGKRSGVAA